MFSLICCKKKKFTQNVGKLTLLMAQLVYGRHTRLLCHFFLKKVNSKVLESLDSYFWSPLAKEILSPFQITPKNGFPAFCYTNKEHSSLLLWFSHCPLTSLILKVTYTATKIPFYLLEENSNKNSHVACSCSFEHSPTSMTRTITNSRHPVSQTTARLTVFLCVSLLGQNYSLLLSLTKVIWHLQLHKQIRDYI